MSQPVDARCPSCQTPLAGSWCHACGEKAFDPATGFSIRAFLAETFESLTSLDSRVLRTLWLLAARPGFLTAEFIAGRRTPYLKPLSLFFLAALAFYVFNPRTTAFFANLADMHRGYAAGNHLSNTFMVDTPRLFAAYVARSGLDAEAAWARLVPVAAGVSKTWLGLIAPAWGLLLWGAFRHRIPWLVPHVVLALHGLAYFIVVDLLGLGVSRALGYDRLGDKYIFLLVVLMGWWCIHAVGRAYRRPRRAAILPGLGMCALFIGLVLVYRQCVTLYVVATG